MLVYVNDLLLTGTNLSSIDALIKQMNTTFAVKDLCRLHYFLGIEVDYTENGFILHQTKYALDILNKVA